MEILIPIIGLGLLGLVLGGFLAYSSKKFEVILDPNIEKVLGVLPGVNCGACGYPGCAAYAEAVALEEEEITLCAPGGAGTVSEIASIMGLEDVSGGEKLVARVLCAGDNSKTVKKYNFDTQVKSCESANLYFAGDKSCAYGCLGYGDCAKVCPFDAMKINEKGIIEIDEEKCTACGKCIKTCPKHILKILPQNSRVTVKCFSKDQGAIARKACDVACIGCGICVRNCPVDAIDLKGNLATIDAEKCVNCGICALKCPTNAIESDIKERRKAVINEEKCVGCTVCSKVCPVDAIEGELKHKHHVLDEKCVGCSLCEQKCPVKCISMETKVVKE